jgi:hypothetical protein
MNGIPLKPPAEARPTEITRFNALRHGVLSRYTVLPREDADEYRALVAALVAEHTPQGPTEEHLQLSENDDLPKLFKVVTNNLPFLPLEAGEAAEVRQSLAQTLNGLNTAFASCATDADSPPTAPKILDRRWSRRKRCLQREQPMPSSDS